MTTSAEMVAAYIRSEEAAFRLQEASRSFDADEARYAAELLELADGLELLPEDDPRIVQMERARYFTSTSCVPGPSGADYIAGGSSDRRASLEAFVEGLADAARDDESRGQTER